MKEIHNILCRPEQLTYLVKYVASIKFANTTIPLATDVKFITMVALQDSDVPLKYVPLHNIFK